MPTPAFSVEINDQNNAAEAAPTDTCSNLCLEPLDPVDCEYALSFPDIMPCTGFSSFVQVGDLCTGTGLCGTNLGLNTCSNSLDFYWKLEPYRCIEHGFVNGTGVILPSNAESDNYGANANPTSFDKDAGGLNPNPMFNFSESNFSPPPSSIDVSADGIRQDDTFNFSQVDFSTHGLNNDSLQGNSENTTSEFTGWWLKGSSSARISVSSWMRLSCSLGLLILTS